MMLTINSFVISLSHPFHILLLSEILVSFIKIEVHKTFKPFVTYNNVIASSVFLIKTHKHEELKNQPKQSADKDYNQILSEEMSKLQKENSKKEEAPQKKQRGKTPKGAPHQTSGQKTLSISEVMSNTVIPPGLKAGMGTPTAPGLLPSTQKSREDEKVSPERSNQSSPDEEENEEGEGDGRNYIQDYSDKGEESDGSGNTKYSVASKTDDEREGTTTVPIPKKRRKDDGLIKRKKRTENPDDPLTVKDLGGQGSLNQSLTDYIDLMTPTGIRRVSHVELSAYLEGLNARPPERKQGISVMQPVSSDELTTTNWNFVNAKQNAKFISLVK